MDTVASCLGRVVDILEASGAFDPGSSPGRGVKTEGYTPPNFLYSCLNQIFDILFCILSF